MKLEFLRFRWRASAAASSGDPKRLRRPSRWALALVRDSLPDLNLAEWRAALLARRRQRRTWQERLLLAQDALLQRHVQTRFRQRMVPAGAAVLNTIEIVPARPQDDHVAIVLTHGFGSGSAFWAPTLDALSQYGRRHVVAVDWNGMGASARTAFPGAAAATATATAADEQYFVEPLEAWRRAMGLEKIVLVGHSLGGLLSSQYALRYPDRVAGLVLVSPAGLLPLPDDVAAPASSSSSFRKRLVVSGWANNITPQDIVRAAGPWGHRLIQRAIRSRFSHLDPADRQLMADYLYEVTAAPPGGEKSLNAILVPFLSDCHPGVFARNPIGARLHDQLPESIRVTIMFGDRDWMFSEAVRDLPLIRSDRAPLVIVDNSGHHLYLDNTQRFVDVVLNAAQADRR